MNTKKNKKDELIFCRTTSDLKEQIEQYAQEQCRTFSSAVEYLIKKSLHNL